ncbi:MAG TPA: PLP-dependent aminotransferase family protein [Kofleriaceae bacterium]|nr:PLP-dependent aminotransferase family protein [Kofleriaceae bacterium]
MDARISALQKEAATRDDVIGLSGGLPADDLMPKDELGRALAYVATRRDEALQYGWPEGTKQLRAWIADRLAGRGATIDPERVIITAGAQQALSLAAQMVAAGTSSQANIAASGSSTRDARIETGAATYPGALDAFRGANVQVIARCDADKQRTRHGSGDKLPPRDAAAGSRDTRAAGGGGCVRYLTAGVDMPTGVAVDHRDLLDRDEPLIVDEAYAELRFDGSVPRPLIADAPERVWHVGTISKTIAPGLRVGWLIPPEAEHDAVLELKSAADLHTASISQAALSRLLGTLDYDALVARARAAYADRAERAVRALRQHASGLEFAEPAGGFSIWIETGERRDEADFLEAALAERVMVDPGSLFRPEPDDRLAFRISYSNAPIDVIDEGIRRLARALRSSKVVARAASR